MARARINVVISNEPLYEKIAALQQQVAVLEAQVIDLTAQVATKQTEIETLTATISTLNTQIESLNIQISSLTTENTRLNNLVTSMGQQINSLVEQINSLNQQISNMNQQISDINNEGYYYPYLDVIARERLEILEALQNKGSNITSSTSFQNYALYVERLNVVPPGNTLALFKFTTETQLQDSSPYHWTLSRFGGTLQFDNVGKFGDGAIYLDGSTAFYLGTSGGFNPFSYPEWTFECWFKIDPNISDHWQTLIANYFTFTAGSSSYVQYYRVNFYDRLNFDYPNTSMVALGTTYLVPTKNVWHHLALCKNKLDPSYLCRFYYDGVFKSWSSSYSTSYNMNFRNYLPLPQFDSRYILFAQSGTTQGYSRSNYFQGWVNDMRFSKICRYTANFTPPTEHFTE